MNDTRKQMTDQDLDDVFAVARAERPDVSPDLMARILADAARATADRQAPAPMAAAPGGFLTSLWAALGGWGGAGGLTAAVAAGLWLGIAPPQSFDTLTTAIFGSTETLSLFAADDILGTEG